MEIQEVKGGESIIKQTNPIRDIEWQLDGQAYDFDSLVRSDITLKAI